MEPDHETISTAATKLNLVVGAWIYKAEPSVEDLCLLPGEDAGVMWGFIRYTAQICWEGSKTYEKKEKEHCMVRYLVCTLRFSPPQVRALAHEARRIGFGYKFSLTAVSSELILG